MAARYPQERAPGRRGADRDARVDLRAHPFLRRVFQGNGVPGAAPANFLEILENYVAAGPIAGSGSGAGIQRWCA